MCFGFLQLSHIPPPLESPEHAPLAIQKDNKRLVTTLKVRVRGAAHDEVHLKCL